MIYTGRWSAKYDNAVKVSISVGDPRWIVPEWKIRNLAPYGIHGKYKGEIAHRMYDEQLSAIGVRGIENLLKKTEQMFSNKDIILCCWENVHKGEACHRRWLADWLKANGGRDIPEAPDSTMGNEPTNRSFEKKDDLADRQISITELLAGGWA